MTTRIAAFLFFLVPAVSLAAGAGGVALRSADVDITDQASLQRGARLFVNYCLSCHSASFMRYNQMAKGLGLTDEQVQENLMFAADKVTEPMEVAMSPNDAKGWFGNAPPDLSVIARSRGADWLYTYMLAFYRDDDPTRPYGINNLVFKDVGMPDVVWDLRGVQVLTHEETSEKHGASMPTIEDLQLQTPGTRTPAEFNRDMRDLVNFLVFVGEPVQAQRHRVGLWVLAFILLFFVVSYALYREYWKDVH
ncbi:MAG: cytochrome c1 [Gammaproteobacteria bacterium]